jgi:hypothetical protein
MPPSALALSGPRYLLSALVSKRHMHRDQAVNSLMQWKECTKNTHVLGASPGTPNLTILLGPDIILISRMTLSAEVLRGLDTPPLRFAIQAGSKMGTALLSAHFYSYSEFRATAASTRAACLYLRGSAYNCPRQHRFNQRGTNTRTIYKAVYSQTGISASFWPRFGRGIISFQDLGREPGAKDPCGNEPTLGPTGTTIDGGLMADCRWMLKIHRYLAPR